MIGIQYKLDDIIYNLKMLPELESVRFIREYPSLDSETPITGFLAAVVVKSAELVNGYLGGLASQSQRGDLIKAEAEIRLYAPKSENGSGLSELVFIMIKGLGSADEDKVITDVKAGSIEFDTNVSAVFRRITFNMEICARKEDEDE